MKVSIGILKDSYRFYYILVLFHLYEIKKKERNDLKLNQSRKQENAIEAKDLSLL